MTISAVSAQMAISNVDCRSDTCRAGASSARHLRSIFNGGCPARLIDVARPIDFRYDNDNRSDIGQNIERGKGDLSMF